MKTFVIEEYAQRVAVVRARMQEENLCALLIDAYSTDDLRRRPSREAAGHGVLSPMTKHRTECD